MRLLSPVQSINGKQKLKSENTILNYPLSRGCEKIVIQK